MCSVLESNPEKLTVMGKLFALGLFFLIAYEKFCSYRQYKERILFFNITQNSLNDNKNEFFVKKTIFLKKF